jgi:hypothetical protein
MAPRPLTGARARRLAALAYAASESSPPRPRAELGFGGGWSKTAPEKRENVWSAAEGASLEQ